MHWGPREFPDFLVMGSLTEIGELKARRHASGWGMGWAWALEAVARDFSMFMDPLIKKAPQ